MKRSFVRWMSGVLVVVAVSLGMRGLFSAPAHAMPEPKLTVEMLPAASQVEGAATKVDTTVIAHSPSAAFTARSKTMLPASYRLPSSRVTGVRNQGQYGTCWTFAAMASAESYAKSKGLSSSPDYSEWQLAYYAYHKQSGLPYFDYTEDAYGNTPAWYNQGGNQRMTSALFARASSPIHESQAKYGQGTPSATIKPTVTLTGLRVYDTPDEIKSAIMATGAVAISYYSDHGYSAYYDEDTSAYYNPDYDSRYSNHAVTIVGWDDTFSKSKFAQTPAGNGAWIIKNSWGTGEGENGYFYLSYYDASLYYRGYHANAYGYTLAKEPTGETQYSYDPLGWTTNIGLGDYETVWVRNDYTASSTGSLAAVGFYTTGDDTRYSLTIQTYNSATYAYQTVASGQSGTVAIAGYTRVNLSKAVSLAKGQKFRVLVGLTDLNFGTAYQNDYPIAVEYNQTATYSSQATASPGQSYFSTNGSNWTDITTYFAKANACIHAFVQDIALSAVVANAKPTAGAATTVTLTMKTTGGAAVTDLNGAATVKVSGYSASAAGTIGSFGGVALSSSSTSAVVTFTNGVGKAPLVLHKAAAQKLTFTVTGLSATVTITPAAAKATRLSLLTAPVAPKIRSARFATQPVVGVKDTYGNLCTADNTTVVTATKADRGAWKLTGTTKVTVMAGKATFTNLGTSHSAAVSGAKVAFTSGSLGSTSSKAITLTSKNAPLLQQTLIYYNQYSKSKQNSSRSVTMTLNGFSVTSVTRGSKSLKKTTDYSVSGSTLTIKEKYLAKQDKGSFTLTVHFSSGTSKSLKVKIVKSTDTVTPKIKAKTSAGTLTSGSVTKRTVTVTATDKSSLTYTAARGGVPISWPSGGKFSTEGKYLVRAFDAAGNAKTFSFTIDKSAPKVTGTNGTGKGVASNGSTNTSVKVTVSDTNPGTTKATRNGTSYAWPANATFTAAGAYVVTAKDKAGNATTYRFTIDTIAPVITVTDGSRTTLANGETSSSGIGVVTATDAGGSGLSSLQYRVGDSGAWTAVPSDGRIAASADCTVNVLAKDKAGNQTSFRFSILMAH